MIPWSLGYNDYKWNQINSVLNSHKSFEEIIRQKDYGFRIDERIVELPWFFSKIQYDSEIMLDAGSALNFPSILKHPKLLNKDLTLFTYFPENYNEIKNRISYCFGDLREIPYKNNLFDIIACISTLEHIDMDNSIYGYSINNSSKTNLKSFEYLKAIRELLRVLKPGGKMFLTIPFGKWENHGFFQQFDVEMLELAINEISAYCEYSLEFFKYKNDGWESSNLKRCEASESFNPHTGVGGKNDMAAHCRAIVAIESKKK